MKIIKSKDSTDGEKHLANVITNALQENLNVLWLVSGGSNIPIAVNVMKKVREDVLGYHLSHLQVSIVDERFGPIGHKDSNWEQLMKSGFDIDGTAYNPVLTGDSFRETEKSFMNEISVALRNSDITIIQLGIGSDGHIAGILPGSPASSSADIVYGYESNPFTRITLTYQGLLKANEIFVFAFGDSKREAIEALNSNLVSLTHKQSQMPCLILREIENVVIYTDQVRELSPNEE